MSTPLTTPRVLVCACVSTFLDASTVTLEKIECTGLHTCAVKF